MILYLFGNVSRWKVQYSIKEYHNSILALSDNKKNSDVVANIET